VPPAGRAGRGPGWEEGCLDPVPATGMPDRDWWSALWPDPEGVLRKLGVSSGMSVVDLCCGDGYFTAPLSRLVAPGRVYALDLAPGMLDRAGEEVARHGANNCEFVLADARELAEHVPEPVDLVLLANTFHGVPEQTGLARRVFEVLKPGGRFTIVNWHPIPREETSVLGERRGPATEMRMSPEKTGAVVEPAGFELERVVDLPPYHYGAIFIARSDRATNERYA
jgi:SAM-dependent methyltransferase